MQGHLEFMHLILRALLQVIFANYQQQFIKNCIIVYSRVVYNLKSLFDFLSELLPNPFFSSASFWVANTEWGAALGVPYGLVRNKK